MPRRMTRLDMGLGYISWRYRLGVTVSARNRLAICYEVGVSSRHPVDLAAECQIGRNTVSQYCVQVIYV